MPISVLELASAFEVESNQRVKKVIVKRRAGDLPIYFANVDKAVKILGWKSRLTLREICRDTWRFYAKDKI
jgi:UDP-glucose 4-epimerase